MALISGKQLKSNSIDAAKLSNLGAGQILVGQGSSTAISAVTITGDITLSSSGSLTLNSEVVGFTELATALVDTQVDNTSIMPEDDTSIPTSSLVKNYVEGVIAAIPGTTVDYAALDASGSISTDLSAGTLSNKVPSATAVKTYVDNSIQGLDVKEAVHTILTSYSFMSATTLTLNVYAGSSSWVVSGHTISSGDVDRILVNSSSNKESNGLYTVTSYDSGSGEWTLTRSSDADNTPGAEVSRGMFVSVLYGTYAGTSWILTTDNPITLGTTQLTFAQFSGATQLTIQSGGGLGLVNTNEIGLAFNNLLAIFDNTLADADLFAVRQDSSGNPKKMTFANVATNLATKHAGNGLSAASGVMSVDGTVTDSYTFSGSDTSGNAVKISSLAFSIEPNGEVQVIVNGIAQVVSYSTTAGNGDCFFAASSATAQSSARAKDAIVAGDVLFWNGTTAGFNLGADDVIKLVYMPK